MRVHDVRPVPYVTQIRCDRCGREARHDQDDGFNNFLQIEFDASWGSAIGDGKHVELDLCHACLKDTLGPWLRTTEAGWAKFPGGIKASEEFMRGVDKLPAQERLAIDLTDETDQP